MTDLSRYIALGLCYLRCIFILIKFYKIIENCI